MNTVLCVVFFLSLILLTHGQTIKIGALMTDAEQEREVNPNYDGIFESHGIYAINGWKMWEKFVNEKGGITVGNVSYGVNITVINVGDNVEKVTRVTNESCRGVYGDFDFFFAPYSSEFTEAAAIVVEEYEKLMIAAFAASKTVFICGDSWESQVGCEDSNRRRFEYTWGTIKPAESFFEDIMKMLRLKGAESAFTWSSDDLFSLSLSDGVVEQSERNNIEIVESMIIGEIPTDDEIDSVIDTILNLEPDVIVASPKYWEGCVAFIKALKDRKVTAKAIITSQCTTYPEVIEALGDDIRYFLDIHLWSPLVRGVEFRDSLHFSRRRGSSAGLFSREYEALYGVDPEHLAAGAFAQGEVLEFALSRSSALDMDEIISNMRLLDESSFYGELGFNGFGMNDLAAVPTFQYDLNTTLGLISPLGSSTLDLIYPFPGWDERVQVIGYLGNSAEIVIFVITLACSLVSVMLGVMIMIEKEKNNSVSAASPYFLLLILFGSLLMYASVLTWMMWMNTFMCISKSWLLGVGFVIIFGTLVAKTHRIKKIFLFNSFTVKAITDKQLFGLVSLLVAIEILINLIWTVVSPSEAYNHIIDENRPLYNYYTCTWNSNDTIFLVIGVVYKALIVFYSLYLSTKLWRHSRSIFVESKQIIFTIYNLTIFGGIFVAIQLSLQDSEAQVMLFVLRSGCIIISVLIAVLSMTIPRLTNPNKGSDYSITKKTNTGSTTVVTDYKKKYLKLKKMMGTIITDNDLSIELS